MSLPADLSKPLPPRPGLRASEAPKDLPPIPVRCESAEILDTGAEASLLPSLSRRAPAPVSHREGSLTGPGGAETAATHTGGKKLFNLADEADLSDDEDATQPAYKEETRTRVEQAPERGMGQVRVREQKKQKAETLRRYHALSELLATEVGYLLDLRALVTVRSRQPFYPPGPSRR